MDSTIFLFELSQLPSEAEKSAVVSTCIFLTAFRAVDPPIYYYGLRVASLSLTWQFQLQHFHFYSLRSANWLWFFTNWMLPTQFSSATHFPCQSYIRHLSKMTSVVVLPFQTGRDSFLSHSESFLTHADRIGYLLDLINQSFLPYPKVQKLLTLVDLSNLIMYSDVMYSHTSPEFKFSNQTFELSMIHHQRNIAVQFLH